MTRAMRRLWISWTCQRTASSGLVVALALAAVAAQPARAQTFTVLYSFKGQPDGAFPAANLIRDAAGNLYGTTVNGGSAISCVLGCGTVFQLDAAGKETVLHSFTDAPGGRSPYGAPIRDAAGNLFGTASEGGIPGAGTLFKINTSGKETVLHNFTGGKDGGFPFAGVTRDASGNLYGTTLYGGNCNRYGGCGTVFKLDKSGKEDVLYTFTGGADGDMPFTDLILDAAGNLYGTTGYGGTYGFGTVFQLGAAGEKVLHSFTGDKDGGLPYGGLIRDKAGNLYGTTSGFGTAGNVFKVNAKGHEDVLYSFTGGTDGLNPYAGLVRDTAGNLFGTTAFGGTGGWGVVFKIDGNGQETVLYAFTGGTDGGTPYASLVRDSKGNLYGTTYYGGAFGLGTVFKLTP